MDAYVCLILSKSRQIMTVEALNAETEAEARQRADALIDGRADGCTYELWRKGKKLAPADPVDR